MLNTKQDGVEIIKQNLANFFKKGDFDISTTYSKILFELDKTPGITKLDILRACNTNLSSMLSRETAIDNETNQLLNWIYDAFEETKIEDNERFSIKKNIDKAITENFTHILDKSNYDRNTIKILKQFDCTKDEFEKNKNHFIDKVRESVLIQYSYNPQEHNNNVNNDTAIKKVNEIFLNNQKQIILQNEKLKTLINENEVEDKQCSDNTIQLKQFASAEEIKLNTEVYNSEVHTKNSTEEPENKVNIEEENTKKANSYISSEDFINSYINKYNEKHNADGKKTEITVADLDERLKKIIVSNVEETNKIIEKVLSKNLSNAGECTNQVKESYELDASNTDTATPNLKTAENEVKETALAISDQDLEELFYEEENIFKRIWKKIIGLFKRNPYTERIGD